MISIENISFGYTKKKFFFKDFSFTQESGNIIGLLGENGAGKSTLLKIIAGLLLVKQGRILVNNAKPFQREPDFLSDIFLVDDTPFLPSLTIKTYLAVYGALYKNFDFDKMHHLLASFQLTENQKLHKISHGQQKKFIIAFALSTNCKLLLLDEPTNGLDIPSKKIFRKVLIESVTENQTVIISTHQVKDVENIIDKIVQIADGKIVFEQETFKITEKYQFQNVSSIANLENVKYYEKNPFGYKVIVPVANNEETEIDIELLFNAIANKAEINL